MTEEKDNPELRLKALTTALDHARIMSNHSAEIRMRNFNFFVVLTVGLVAGFAKLNLYRPIEIVGLISSVLFLGIDYVANLYIEYNLNKVRHLEPRIWSYAELAKTKAFGKEPPASLFSLLYRSVFIVAGVVWTLALFKYKS